jgi:hypothetical protein
MRHPFLSGWGDDGHLAVVLVNHDLRPCLPVKIT